MAESEPNIKRPLRLLSLDGGGVRGLSSLLILQELMENVAKEEKRLRLRHQDSDELPHPCDYFDLIGGTSTGGIIAILLGRLRLDIRECISIYSRLSSQIFKKDHSIHFGGAKLPTGPTRFSGAVLERAIKDALVAYGFDENEKMWDDSLFEERTPLDDSRENIWADMLEESPTSIQGSQTIHPPEPVEDLEVSSGTDNSNLSHSSSRKHAAALQAAVTAISSNPNPKRKSTWKIHSQNSVQRRKGQRGCRAFVVTALKNALGLPRILATYDPNDRTTRIWEALRATSAAPTFFEEMTFGSPKMTYLDGGMGFNNPCAEVNFQAKSLWESRSIGVIVSIGTGLQTIPSIKKGISWLPFGLGMDVALVSALAAMSTSTSRVDNEMQRLTANTDSFYYRFDVDSGMANVSLEQWMKEDEMASLTKQYMRGGRQLQRSRSLGEQLAKLSNLPEKFEIRPSDFSIGMNGKDVAEGYFSLKDIDFKTGYELGLSVTPEQAANKDRRDSFTGHGGLAVDVNGATRRIFPIVQDLDHDGRKEEATILICHRAENVCIRSLRQGIPQGRYKVKWIVAFDNTTHTAPTELIFSVGRPYNRKNFTRRYVDVRIAPDVVPVLLHPDAVRVRVGRHRYAEKIGKSWTEINGDVEVDVGLDGTLGIIISKKFEEGVFVGGWAFGGCVIEPVFVGEGKGGIDPGERLYESTR
jgi:predicted acylesterase/phospholipase RssA